MLFNYNKFRVLEVFLNDPIPKNGEFQLREISRLTSLAPKSVKNYLEELISEDLILKKKQRATNYPVYTSNYDNPRFKFIKKIVNEYKLRESGLIEYIYSKSVPKCIVLFGSYSRGEDLLDSDIDLFVESKYVYLDLQDYEVLLNRKINVLFNEKFENLSKELKNNLINSVVVNGYLKWKD